MIFGVIHLVFEAIFELFIMIAIAIGAAVFGMLIPYSIIRIAIFLTEAILKFWRSRK